MPTNMINPHCCRWRVFSVNSQLYEQRDLKHCSGLGFVSPEEILKHTPLLLVMQFTTLTTEKAFTRQLPGLSDKCVSYRPLQQMLTNSILQHFHCLLQQRSDVSLCECFQIFPSPFSSFYGRRVESRTIV